MLYGVDQCKLKDRSVSLVVQAVQLVSTVVHLVCTVQAVSQVSQDLDFPSFLRNGRISCHFFFRGCNSVELPPETPSSPLITSLLSAVFFFPEAFFFFFCNKVR